jgi:hypothetical protein
MATSLSIADNEYDYYIRKKELDQQYEMQRMGALDPAMRQRGLAPPQMSNGSMDAENERIRLATAARRRDILLLLWGSIMEMTPYAKALRLGKKALDELLIPTKVRKARKQAELEMCKLEEEIAIKQVDLHNMCAAENLNFAKILTLQDDIFILERKQKQYKTLLDQMFPDEWTSGSQLKPLLGSLLNTSPEGNGQPLQC